MSIITNPLAWRDTSLVTPSRWWEALAADNRFWFYNDGCGGGSGSGTNTTWLPLVESIPAGPLTFAWEIVTPRSFGLHFFFQYVINGVVQPQVDLGNVIASGQIIVTIPPGMTSFFWGIVTDGLPVMYSGVVAVGDVIIPPPVETSKRVLRWSRARVVTPRVEQYKIYRGTGVAGTLAQIGLVEVNFELAPAYDWQHPHTFIDETADPDTTYRYRVDALTDDGRTLPGNILTSIP